VWCRITSFVHRRPSCLSYDCTCPSETSGYGSAGRYVSICPYKHDVPASHCIIRLIVKMPPPDSITHPWSRLLTRSQYHLTKITPFHTSLKANPTSRQNDPTLLDATTAFHYQPPVDSSLSFNDPFCSLLQFVALFQSGRLDTNSKSKPKPQ